MQFYSNLCITRHLSWSSCDKRNSWRLMAGHARRMWNAVRTPGQLRFNNSEDQLTGSRMISERGRARGAPLEFRIRMLFWEAMSVSLKRFAIVFSKPRS